MNADVVRPHSPGREMGNDQGDVSDTGDHRVGLVDGALQDRCTPVRVDIGDDGETLRLTQGPELAECVSVYFDVPAQARRIQVIEVLDVGHAARVGTGCQKKRPRLTTAFPSPVEFADQRAPLPNS